MKLPGLAKWWVPFRVHLVPLFTVILFLAAPLHAQSAPTTTSACPPSGSVRGDGADLQCRMQTLLTKHQNLLTALQNKLGPNCSADPHCNNILTHINRAAAANNRALKANSRTTAPDGSSDYSDLNVVRKSKCKGKSSDCASGNGALSGGDSDPTVGSDLADQLDDAASGLDDAANALTPTSQASSLVRSFTAAAPSASFESLYDYTTDPDFPAGLHLGNPDPKATIGAKFAALLAAQVVEAARDGMEDACNQVLVALGEGGNTSAACIPLMIAARALDATYEILDFIDMDTMGWEVHGAYLRAANLNDNLGTVDQDVNNGVSSVNTTVTQTAGNTQQLINALSNQVTALQNQLTSVANALQTQISTVQNDVDERLVVSKSFELQLLQLLLVPDGQRTLPASLLSCTGDKGTKNPCPPIVIVCSSTTGQCSFASK